MRRPLHGMGVVVTGASSGIGRATAQAFAAHGARIVVVARSAAALDDVVAECRQRGGRALAVPTDVADPVAVERLAAKADAWLGGVDTWVNAAAVLVAGRLPDVPVSELERAVATNVLGSMLCSRAALTLFERRQRGVLINVSSLLGILPNPNVPVYRMTKFAVRGLSITAHEGYGRRSPIRVCTVLPAAGDSPMFERAANHLGHELRAIPPAISPHRVAAAIIRCARRPRREVTNGLTGWGLLVGHRVAPRLTEWLVGRYSARLVWRHEDASTTDGALFHPPASGRVDGGYRRLPLRRSAGDAVGRWWAAASGSGAEAGGHRRSR